MRNTSRLFLSTTLLLAVSATAYADSAIRKHDGFHFQVSGGLGFYNVAGSEPANQDFGGMTMPGSILFGGTVMGKIALGGGMYFDYAPSPKYELGGNEVTGQVSSQTILGLGMYADYYVDPVANGLHFQVFAGWGGLETSFNGNVGGSDPTGLVVAGGVGYEWWLSDQWSGGVLGRLVYAPLDLNGTSFRTIEPGLVGTLTWH